MEDIISNLNKVIIALVHPHPGQNIPKLIVDYTFWNFKKVF